MATEAPRALLGAGNVEGGATVLSELTAQQRQQLVFKEIPSHSRHKTSYREQKLAEVGRDTQGHTASASALQLQVQCSGHVRHC